MSDRHQTRWVIGLLAVGLVLRVLYSAGLDHNLTYQFGSSDSGWYLSNAYTLVTGLDRGDLVVDVSRLSVPPLFLIFIGVPQAFLPLEGAVLAVRVMQAVLGVATAYFAYRVAVSLTGSARAALVTLGAVALSPVFVLEAGQITSETLFIFLLTGGLWCYAEYITLDGRGNSKWLIGAAVLFGLATLTRAVFLAFPLGIALHLLVIYRKQALKWAALFLSLYAAVVLTWTVYSYARWDRLVIAGEGLSAFLYFGAAGWDAPDVADQTLREQLGQAEGVPFSPTQADFAQGAVNTITGDPLGYVRRRVGELGGAYLQPHGTTYFSGASVRDLFSDWLRDDRSLGGFVALMGADHFLEKLTLYVFHFGMLILGVVGTWRVRRSRVTWALIGYVVYTTLIHLVLLATPRYLFPSMVCWYVLASGVFYLIPPPLLHIGEGE